MFSDNSYNASVLSSTNTLSVNMNKLKISCIPLTLTWSDSEFSNLCNSDTVEEIMFCAW